MVKLLHQRRRSALIGKLISCIFSFLIRDLPYVLAQMRVVLCNGRSDKQKVLLYYLYEMLHLFTNAFHPPVCHYTLVYSKGMQLQGLKTVRKVNWTAPCEKGAFWNMRIAKT